MSYILQLTSSAILMAIGKDLKKLLSKQHRKEETHQSMASTGTRPDLGMIDYRRYPAFSRGSIEDVDQDQVLDRDLFAQGKQLSHCSNYY